MQNAPKRPNASYSIDSGAKIYACDVCGKKCSSRSTRSKHKKACHKPMLEEQMKIGVEAEKQEIARAIESLPKAEDLAGPPSSGLKRNYAAFTRQTFPAKDLLVSKERLIAQTVLNLSCSTEKLSQIKDKAVRDEVLGVFEEQHKTDVTFMFALYRTFKTFVMESLASMRTEISKDYEARIICLETTLRKLLPGSPISDKEKEAASTGLNDAKTFVDTNTRLQTIDDRLQEIVYLCEATSQKVNRLAYIEDVLQSLKEKERVSRIEFFSEVRKEVKDLKIDLDYVVEHHLTCPGFCLPDIKIDRAEFRKLDQKGKVKRYMELLTSWNAELSNEFVEPTTEKLKKYEEPKELTRLYKRLGI